MNLDTLLRQQNPHWFDANYHFVDANWFHRPVYADFFKALSRDLMVSLTGLRRVGKSTLLKQAIEDLRKKYPAQSIFYFSFDQSVVKEETETLRRLLDLYAQSILHQELTRTEKKVFIFLDEVQIVPHWQDVLKTLTDLNKNLKFIVSGSSSLFISKKSTESLAGRIKEIIVSPLSFREYLEMETEAKREIEKVGGLEKYSQAYPQYLNAFFEKYLEMGQFPQPVVNRYSPEEIKSYLKTIEEKILEIDLPKTFNIQRQDILKIIFDSFKDSSGALLSYENLSGDLGVDIRTTINYVEYLKRAYLLDLCLNQTKKLVKAGRTLKKFYLASTNFGQNLSLGAGAETYVFNFFKKMGYKVEFFRYQTSEIDFILTNSKGEKIPVEVKYREKVKESDEKTLWEFAKAKHCPKAFLITKNFTRPAKKIGSTRLYCLPVRELELTLGKP